MSIEKHIGLHMDTTPTIDTRKPGKKRIMVQVWGTLAQAIDRDLKALHLKRDGYLNDLFTREIDPQALEKFKAAFPPLRDAQPGGATP